jgi:multidrug efflux pump subunit AcrA (membrane-fusion protein)
MPVYPSARSASGSHKKGLSRAKLGIPLAALSLALLTGCEQNSFVPPPPPKVEVALPAQHAITRYLEATGNTAPVKTVDLVARVQGFLQSINYQDGTLVKEGTTLFAIEPETYKLKLEQAQAAEAGVQASLKQTEADYKRQSDLVARQAVSQATLDQSMIASTCLAVLFVPTFFVVIQRFETWLKERGKKMPKPNRVQTPQTGAGA